jgi:F0F1-type ATP synthase assembly protein I
MAQADDKFNKDTLINKDVYKNPRINPEVGQINIKSDNLRRYYPIYDLLNCIASKYVDEQKDEEILEEAIHTLYTRIKWCKWHLMSVIHSLEHPFYVLNMSNNCGYYSFWFCNEYLLEDKDFIVSELKSNLIRRKKELHSEELRHQEYLRTYIKKFNKRAYSYVRRTIILIVSIRGSLFGIGLGLIVSSYFITIPMNYMVFTLLMLLILGKTAPEILGFIYTLFIPKEHKNEDNYRKLEDTMDFISAKLELYEVLTNDLYKNLNKMSYKTIYNNMLTGADLRNMTSRLCRKGSWDLILTVNTLSFRVIFSFLRHLDLNFNVASRLFAHVLHLRYTISIGICSGLILITLIAIFSFEWITPLMFLSKNSVLQIFGAASKI